LKENQNVDEKIFTSTHPPYELTQTMWRAVAERYFGYKMSSIFEHFLKLNKKDCNNDLCVRSINWGPFILPKLTRCDSEREIIAVNIFGGRQKLTNLQKLIEDEPEITISKLTGFNENIERTKSLLNEFQGRIKDISYHITPLGLNGQCRVEQELSPRHIINTRVRSFFGSKSRVGPYTLF
jgi:hypothetical protein